MIKIPLSFDQAKSIGCVYSKMPSIRAALNSQGASRLYEFLGILGESVPIRIKEFDRMVDKAEKRAWVLLLHKDAFVETGYFVSSFQTNNPKNRVHRLLPSDFDWYTFSEQINQGD